MKKSFGVNEFQNTLIDSVRIICKEQQLNFDGDKDRGEAFSMIKNFETRLKLMNNKEIKEYCIN
jgi:hypothetical protein